ncbi:prepilin peptidase [Mycobacterium gastri]|uniref:Prepilin type IV endopeptidase peptidase domain-containing protein n=1 Tax=Mycobacterium gastri TaxID=1777 RepID=A0A1X1VW47_MYCGS|nr:A24 family peptidase [Mycobacterium gastri]ETW25043.1 type IV prepilin leader peptidase [Mycobacterium gastri 'Wayne']ORV73290.1 hypothetical protein AWC07_02730 [Mycobacterium gastri]
MRIGVAAVVLAWMAVLSCYDLRQRRLPNLLTLPGAAAVLLAATIGGRGLAALAGATALTAVYLLVHLLAPTGMGAGDVKLAVGVGALAGCFGADAWFLAALAAPLLTAVCGVVARFIGGADTTTVPHGPSMCVATAGALAMVLM